MRCGAARCSEVRCEDESGVSKQEGTSESRSSYQIRAPRLTKHRMGLLQGSSRLPTKKLFTTAPSLYYQSPTYQYPTLRYLNYRNPPIH